jgi:DNA/RNA-binding domain of Phe-tRNA-synthetase-like protein
MPVRLAVDPAVLHQFPDTEVCLVVAWGVRNDEVWPALDAAVERFEQEVAAGEWTAPGEESPEIASWHAAYRKFGTNPRRARPSVEALGRRVAKSGTMPRITPAVNAYNLVSLQYGVPAGAFDLDALGASVEIRPARENDVFTPLGEPGEREEPKVGEIVYAQGTDVLTRHWNHRDSDLTKVTAESRNIVFMMERVSAEAMPTERLAAAQAALAELVRRFAAEVTLAVIDPATPAVDLGRTSPSTVAAAIR